MQSYPIQTTLTRNNFYPYNDEIISLLSLPEIGNKKSNESTESGEEGISNVKSDKLTDDEEENTSPPKISYNVEEDLEGYKTTQMRIKLAEMFDGEYIRNNDGTPLDGGKPDDKL